jgi:hypothetical protein
VFYRTTLIKVSVFIKPQHHDLKEGLGAGLDVLMHQDLPSLVEEANLHRPGVEIDPTVCCMLFGIESHEVSSSSFACYPSTSSPTVVCRGGGLNTYHRTGADAQ